MSSFDSESERVARDIVARRVISGLAEGRGEEQCRDAGHSRKDEFNRDLHIRNIHKEALLSHGSRLL